MVYQINADNRFNADWDAIWTAEEAERELDGFKFTGPGWYITKTDTILVITDGIPITATEKWSEARCDLFKQLWPVGTKFRFYVYNNRNPGELFGVIAMAPVRVDER